MPRSRQTRKSNPKSRKKPTVEEGWWSIRAILDERASNGCVEYLVDWEPDRVTGETFEPTWSTEVTEEAKSEWDTSKALKAASTTEKSSVCRTTENQEDRESRTPRRSVRPTTENRESRESQSPRPSNWRQLKRIRSQATEPPRSSGHSSDGDDDEEENPTKRARTQFSAALSETSVPSFTSAPSVVSAADTAELGGVEIRHPRNQVTVELSKAPTFDLSEYQTQSTPPATSSQSVVELEDGDARLAIFSQLSQQTVPDSQEASGQSRSNQSRVLTPSVVSTTASQTLTQEAEIQRVESQGPVDKETRREAEAPEAVQEPSQETSLEFGQETTQIASQGPTREASQELGQDTTYTASQGVNQEAGLQDNSHSTITDSSRETATSTTTESNIPSCQPRDSGAHDQPVSQALETGPIIPKESGAVSSSPGVVQPFLTQPRSSAGFQANSVLESSGSRVEATTSEDNSTNTTHLLEHPAQRDSQAAQIVRHDTEPPTEEFTTSGDSPDHSVPRTEQADSGDGSARSLLPLRDSGGVSGTEESFWAHAERLSSQLDATRSQPSIMEGLRSEPLSSSGRVSAADELKQLCSFDDLIADPAPSQGDQGVLEPDARQPSSPTEAERSLAIDPAIPPSSALELHPQPSDEVHPWVPDSASVSQTLTTSALGSEPLLTQAPLDSLNELTTQHSSSFQDDFASGTLRPGDAEVQQATVSPADITRHIAAGPASMDPSPLLPQSGISPSALDLTGESVTMAQLPIRSDEDMISQPSSYSDESPVEHLVTLPFQARMRPLYDDTILEYKNEVKRFGDVFSSEIYMEPDASLLARIDELLGRLQNICDFPQDLDGTTLAKLSPSDQVKYSYDANPKFHFVFELLEALQKDLNVLIVAKSREVLTLLFHVADSLKIECRCEAIDQANHLPDSISPVRLTLALPTEQVDATTYDIVIGFDPTYAQSAAAKQLSSLSNRKSPHVLLLVTTLAIEHIDLRIPGDLPSSERRNALLSGIVRARKLISDPERGYPEPHEVAKIFGDYFNGAGETVVAWEPMPIPDQVLDIYETSRSQHPDPDGSSNDNDGNKRKLDDEEGSDAKRIRLLPLKETLVDSHEPVLSDEVREMLAAASSTSTADNNTDGAKTLVSVSTLEALAEEHANYRHRLNDFDSISECKKVITVLEKQVKEHERTINQIYGRHRAAIQDRTQFEKDKRGAEAALQASQQSALAQSTNYQKQISELKAEITRLSTTEGEAQVQQSLEQPLKEAREKIESLEKKLASARTQLDFVTNQYQETRSEAATMRAEIRELKLQNQKLQQTSKENFVRIHQIQAESSEKQHLAQISELRTLLRERELELDRTRDELQQLKNGRRETRQVSMPRSPRMGMMSPRMGRAYGGSTSRGTSPTPGSGTDGAGTTPVPGMQYLTDQTGNVRWPRLRE